jgi:hypothetical protein
VKSSRLFVLSSSLRKKRKLLKKKQRQKKIGRLLRQIVCGLRFSWPDERLEVRRSLSIA